MLNRLPELLPDTSHFSADIVIEPSLAGAAQELLTRAGFAGKHLLTVCDANTHEALGRRLADELAHENVTLLRFEGKVHAAEAALAEIQSCRYDALLAVGSGVINDLCKYASHRADKPYAVFPTAPSMNGYLSASASMTFGSVKESHTAHLPVGIFCDMGVIASAPVRLIRSGLGDSLCRSTAQADWLLSHLLLDTPYTPLPFELLKPYEAGLFAQADRLQAGDAKVIELLMRILLVSGIGMTLAGGSYPASQGEHMIAHTMEMRHGAKLPETYHGEQVGVATLTMARVQQEQLARDLMLPTAPNWQEALALYFGRKQAQLLSPGPERKYRLYEREAFISERLRSNAAEIKERLAEVMAPEADLRAVLKKAGAPTTAQELGWQESDYGVAVAHARYTRDRFTFLDVQ